MAFAVNTRHRGLERRSFPRSTGWAQLTRRREVLCGVNKDRRADTVYNFFCGFGIEMVELPLTASASARIEEARKEEARKAYDKRNARRGAPPKVERAKSTLRSESYGGLPRASAAPRPQQNSSLASALAETQGALQATIACLSKLGKELKLPAHCARCSSQTAPRFSECARQIGVLLWSRRSAGAW